MYERREAPSPQAVLLLVHGLGAHCGRWEFLSQFLLQSGISSYAIELKGFGETKGPRGHIDSFGTYFGDICTVRAIISKEHPGANIFLLGESLGGLLAFLLAIREPGLFNGLICISPAFKGRAKLPPGDYIRIFTSLFYRPQRQFTMPFNAQMCTRDTRYQAVMDNDEREHHLASSQLLVNVLIAQARASLLKGRLTLPTLFLVAGEDLLVDPKTSMGIFKGLRVKDKTLIRYPDMYHALSIDLGREKVFEDILRWVQERAR